MIKWKNIEEKPTEVCEANTCTTPHYFAKAEGVDVFGDAIVGFTFYSYVTREWFPIVKGDSVYPVVYWTDEKI